jgi:hypothetical protein
MTISTRLRTASASASSSTKATPARHSAGDRDKAFSSHGSRFVDDVRAWRTVEPAIDFTATAALAFALTS